VTGSVLGNDEHPDLPARIAAATALRELANALVAHEVRAADLDRITVTAEELTAAACGAPRRSRIDEAHASPAYTEAILSGRLGDLPDDGTVRDLFHDSPVSGSANPAGVGLRISRDGNEAVGHVRIGPAFEGAPGRAHGGIVAACFDETMGGLLPIIESMAFTRSLTVEYHAPCPLDIDLEFRARFHHRHGRKLRIRAEASAAGEVFARSDALFIAIDLAAFRTNLGITRRGDQ
jgi:acyl-coenzyme A thioesterase PaaI-like protein